MIGFIKGKVVNIGDSYVIIDCHDIGYHISMPQTALYELSLGMDITVYTHLAVREDDLSLFGFLSFDELSMFKLLITVSGIGPKGALGILSTISVDELKMAIAAGDAKLIASSKGVGLKTAQKLCVELKGKFKDFVPVQSVKNNKASGDNINTAIMFVESTGVSRTQCLNAISKSELPDDADVDTIIDTIFKNLNV